MTSPSVAGHAPALRACWHPVAYSGEPRAGRAARRRPARRGARPLAGQRGHGARVLRPLHPSRHRALARHRRGRRDRLPLPRLALPLRRRLHRASRSSPTRRACPPRRGRRRSPARSATGSSGSRSRSRAGRCPRSPSSRIRAWATVSCGPYSWACDASRQVENFTDFGHFPFVHPGLLGDPERPVVPEPRGARPTATSSATRSSGPRRRPTRTSRSSATRSSRRPSAAAATSCTSRTRSCSGSAGAARRAWSTSSPAGRRAQTGRRASSRSAATTTSSSPTPCCRSSRT